MLVRDDAGVSLWSRRGTDLTATFPEIAAAAAEQVAPGAVLDGELVVWTGGRLDFEVLQERMGRGARSAAAHARRRPASFALFDVLAVDGRDVRGRPLRERRALLEEAATSWRPPLNLSPVTGDVDEAREWFETYTVAGVEGLVVKGAGEAYRGGERAWLKVKHRATLDVVCAAVIGTMTQPQQVVAGLPIDGELRIVGRTGPLTPTARRALAVHLRPPAGEHPWPAQVAPGAFGRFNADRSEPVTLTRVEPLVVEVSADAAWSGRSFRHALRLLRARPDAEVSAVEPPRRGQ
ncbi:MULTISPECIES: ATP-dependent DNA ligase [Cellulosimicrobium]|uniref:ATP-dependent DNA ligase n=1 Tax=Cellulosimicrobium TaxID=157920 RepID=UPI001BA553BB|nr:ATP-dependent DNA ligase [Cellulosimicrobium cellulans]QUC01983.1 ATP-dependent DNA ligase [Cellulosimicrobium cellulans]